MTSPIIWDGQPTSPVGMTPFGFYDDDTQFVSDAPKVATACAARLGYPVLDVELSNDQLYGAFEEAITEYGAQVNQFNIREHMLTLQGLTTASNITQLNLTGTPLPTLVKIARAYGTEVGVGGNVDVRRSSFFTSGNLQDYDLQAIFTALTGSNERIEITKVYYENSPAIARYFDPFAGSGVGLQNLMTEFGFDGYSPAVSFVMMPVYEDLLRIQAIEFNDMVRKSSFSFNIVNNKLKLFPIPTSTFQVWFDYYITKDKFDDLIDFAHSGSVVADYSNVPYQKIQYRTINDVGRMWIFKYTFALTKELLGNIRSKYSTIPIPNADITLDGAQLRAESAAEKEELLKEIRETLAEAGRQKQMEKHMSNSKNMMEIFKGIPTFIYIG